MLSILLLLHSSINRKVYKPFLLMNIKKIKGKMAKNNNRALEDLIGEEAFKEIAGKPFGIDPNTEYKRREFVKRAGDLFDVEEYYRKLKENINDVDALNDLADLAVKYMVGGKDAEKENRLQLLENHNLALSQANKLLDTGYYSMAKFIERNRDIVLDKLSEEQLYKLFLRVPLYETGNEELDRIRDLRNKVVEIKEAEKEEKDISSIIKGEIDNLVKKSPKEQMVYFFENIDLVMHVYRNIVVRTLHKKLVSLFKDKEGNLNKKELINYFERVYKVAEDFISDELKDERDKAEYWNENLKPQYVEIARELYGPEKAEQKKKDDPKKEERKAYARELGLTNP